MSATASRVHIPANNRVHSNAALQTHGIWQTAIEYDPYAPKKDGTKDLSLQKPSLVDTEGENMQAFKGYWLLPASLVTMSMRRVVLTRNVVMLATLRFNVEIF